MKIKLYKIASDIEDKEREQYSDSLINEINLALIDDDIEIRSDVDSPINLLLVESGGSEAKFLELLPSLHEPILLLETSKYNSLPATLEINTYCHLNKIQSIMIVGSLDEKINLLKNITQFIRAREDIRGSRLGVIGKPSDWLISQQIDYKEVKDKFYIDLIDINYEEFILEVDKKIAPKIKNYSELLLKLNNDEKRLNEALYIYSALKRIINKYNLDGFTIRCFDLLKSHKATSCLALALLNQENVIASCEGDILSLITMLIIYKISGFSSFQANPSTLDFDKKQILFSHCTLPFNMAREYELDTHFESNLGIGIRGELESGKISIVKLCPDLKSCLAVVGNINSNPKLKGYCRTQVLVDFDYRNMVQLASIPFGNHVVISYGDYYRQFLSYIDLSLSIYESNKEKEKNN